MRDLRGARDQLRLQSHDLFVARKQQLLQSIDVVGEFGGRPHDLSMREPADAYKADFGSQLHLGCRQSIPSSSIDSCAGVSETLPLFACG
jgi:hypothetical protein